MTLPEKVKVGGKFYTVTVTEDLKHGYGYSAEVDFLQLEIRVKPSHPQKMHADFLHELMHAVYDHLGYKDHDEKRIDELSNALHMLIIDNPEMFVISQQEAQNADK